LPDPERRRHQGMADSLVRPDGSTLIGIRVGTSRPATT